MLGGMNKILVAVIAASSVLTLILLVVLIVLAIGGTDIRAQPHPC